MRSSFLACLALILVGLSACSSGLEGAKLAKSPNFQQGYDDGCATANEQGADFRGRQVRDEALYKADPDYRGGWSSGFSSCRTTNTPPGTQPGASPLSGPLPGVH